MKFLLTAFCIALFFTCKTNKKSEVVVAPELHRGWKISNEEGSGEITILRPSEFDFPPIRLREELIFNKDNTLTYKTLDAVDLPVIKKGRWEWIDEHTLKITISEDNRWLWQVINLNERKLEVIKKNY